LGVLMQEDTDIGVDGKESAAVRHHAGRRLLRPALASRRSTTTACKHDL
jgi:hypothetical protein